MLKKWAELVDQVGGYILLAGVFMLAGLLMSTEWRRRPLLPLAGLLVGPVFGLFGAAVWGEAGAIAMTFVGTVGGPTLVMIGQDQTTIRRIAEAALDRIAPDKREEE